MSYQQNNVALSDSDLAAIKNYANQLGLTPPQVQWLEQSKNSTELNDCLKHRQIQEQLRNQFSCLSSQWSWDTNNYIIHNNIWWK